VKKENNEFDLEALKKQYMFLIEENTQLKLDKKILEAKLKREVKHDLGISPIKYESNFEGLMTQIQVKDEIIIDLENEISDLKGQSNMLRLMLDSKESEIKKYHEEIENAVHSKIAFEDQKVLNEKLTLKYNDMKDKNINLKDKAVNLERQVTELTGKIDKIQSCSITDSLIIEDHLNNGFYNEQASGRKAKTEINVSTVLSNSYENEKKSNDVLERDFERIKEALKREQMSKLDQSKDVIQLETRLKIAEDQISEYAKTQTKLEREIAGLQDNLKGFTLKMKESEELFELCSGFLQQNGLLASSFLSEDFNF